MGDAITYEKNHDPVYSDGLCQRRAARDKAELDKRIRELTTRFERRWPTETDRRFRLTLSARTWAFFCWRTQGRFYLCPIKAGMVVAMVNGLKDHKSGVLWRSCPPTSTVLGFSGREQSLYVILLMNTIATRSLMRGQN